jgi:hypothetical protein
VSIVSQIAQIKDCDLLHYKQRVMKLGMTENEQYSLQDELLRSNPECLMSVEIGQHYCQTRDLSRVDVVFPKVLEFKTRVSFNQVHLARVFPNVKFQS